MSPRRSRPRSRRRTTTSRSASAARARRRLTALALRCLGGELQAQLWPTSRSQIREAQEADRGRRAALHDRRLAPDEVIFVATGVTEGDLLKPVRYLADSARSQSIVMCTKCNWVRFIDGIHFFARERREEVRLPGYGGSFAAAGARAFACARSLRRERQSASTAASATRAATGLPRRGGGGRTLPRARRSPPPSCASASAACRGPSRPSRARGVPRLVEVAARRTAIWRSVAGSGGTGISRLYGPYLSLRIPSASRARP